MKRRTGNYAAHYAKREFEFPVEDEDDKTTDNRAPQQREAAKCPKKR